MSKQCTVALNCKVLPAENQITAHGPCMSYSHNKVCTLLSTKMLNSLEEIVMLAEKSLSWNRNISSTTTQLLWLLYTPAKSEHMQPGMYSSYLRHHWE